MGRRIIRRRRPTTTRRTVVRRGASADGAVSAPIPQPTERKGSPLLIATTNTVRNLVLPKLATVDEIAISGLANTPEDALKMLIQDHPDCVLLDIDFGGELVGLDTAKLMQRTRAQAAIIMLVPEIDPEVHHSKARRFGTSWSYIKKSTATRENLLNLALKSAIRGVQWIEPALSRPLAELWKVANEARDLEARRSTTEAVTLTTSIGRKALKNSVTPTTASDESQEPVDTDALELEDDQADDSIEAEMAPGIHVKSTLDDEIDGVDVTTVSVGKGGIGRGVGKVRRAG
ncbi:MAG: hypothetical protein O6922_01210 [Chloroflexi bacterium]|nr:hypothetical protein [Chloroflexota bacterium]